MNYSFGLFKPIYKGTYEDWAKLQEKIAWCINDFSIYPNLIVDLLIYTI
jgi:hypothetical protein